jgi:cytochrome oxidase Cu insertion factor (SCO1/SenC/PrrC family)
MISRVVWAFLLAACVLGAARGRAADNSPDGSRRNAPIGVGERAPDFTLPDQNERPHTLFAERGRRAVVLVFYRGYW